MLADRRVGHTVGIVPTMGALHEGHLSLVKAAKRDCDRVAVTIFVNPLQFGPAEDLERYPRPIEVDLEVCEKAGVNVVFNPDLSVMYPEEIRTAVHVTGLTEHLCGAHRPGHFDGVTTVVMKLFQILPADRAYFGEKDFQQLQVIRRMVRDLNIPMAIIGCPIVREKDGLALSSRNAYLSADEREQALALSRGLFAAQEQVSNGQLDAAKLVAGIYEVLANAGIDRIDYIEVVDPDSLAVLTRIDRQARICLAAHVGSCRLIDNVGVYPPDSEG